MTETQLNNTYFYFSLNIHEIHLFCLFRKNRSRKRRVLEKHVFTVHTKRYVDLSKYKKTSKGQVHETGSKQHLYVDQVKPNTDHSKHSKFYQCKTFWLHSIKNKSCRLLVLFIWGNDTLPAAINTFKNKKMALCGKFQLQKNHCREMETHCSSSEFQWHTDCVAISYSLTSPRNK